MKDGDNFSGNLIGANGGQTLDVQFSVMDATQLGVMVVTATPCKCE